MTARPWAWPAFWRAWTKSVRQARQLFRARPPVVVLGLGGYASAPPIVAAARLGIPTAIFNPDATPGRANQRLARRVDRVFVQWDSTVDLFRRARKVQCTGCPIRSAFLNMRREDACRALRLNPDRMVLLITGASQGARSINHAAMELFDLWRIAADWQIVHLTGAADLELCRQKYAENHITARTLAFTEHMAECMAAANLIIARAGASTLAEITAMGKPAVLMPYPYDKRRHQDANARVMAESHAAVVVQDADDPVENARRLREVLRDVMKSPERLRRMGHASGAIGRTDAAEQIAFALYEMAGRIV